MEFRYSAHSIMIIGDHEQGQLKLLVSTVTWHADVFSPHHMKFKVCHLRFRQILCSATPLHLATPPPLPLCVLFDIYVEPIFLPFIRPPSVSVFTLSLALRCER